MPLTLNLQGTAAVPISSGSLTVGPISVTGTAIPQPVNVNVTAAGLTITVPTTNTGTWVGMIITPPTNNAFTITYRTTVGDTGINLPQNTPSLIVFDPANVPATIYLKSGTTTVGQTQLLFF